MGEKQIVRVYTDQSSLLRLHMPNEVGSALNTHKARGQAHALHHRGPKALT